MNIENIINKLVKDVAENKMKILDDFLKAYFASRWQDYFSKQKKIDFRRIELIEDRSNSQKIVFYFRLKKGKLKKK